MKDSQVPMLPLRVMGMASRGMLFALIHMRNKGTTKLAAICIKTPSCSGTASRVLDRESCEDTITLSVDWGVPEGVTIGQF